MLVIGFLGTAWPKRCLLRIAQVAPLTNPPPLMIALCSLVASIAQPVPDTGATALMLGGGLLGLGFIARFVKNRKK